MADVSSLQAAMHPVNSGGAFAIVSGENPKYIPEVKGGHKGLEQLLNQGGFQYEPTDGDYGESLHSPVFIVHGLGRDQAMELGRRLGQESVVYSNNGQHEHIYTNGPNAGKYHPPTGEAMKIFPVRPDDGLTTRVPGLGHVRLNFDYGKLLDVPTKGSSMSEDTQKAEVSVADLKKKLADTLNRVAKSMEEFAAREVDANDDASVGDLRSSRTQLSLESPAADWMAELSKGEDGIDYVEETVEVCPLCKQLGACPCLLKNVGSYAKLTKSHTLAIAAAMQKVYHSYLNNVAKPQFPNDPGKQHDLALAAAKDWATRAKSPGAIYQTALGYDPDDMQATQNAVGSAPSVPAPDSLGPEAVQASPVVKGEMCKGCNSDKSTCKCAKKGEMRPSDTQRKKDTAENIRKLKQFGAPPEVIEREKATSQSLKERWRSASKAEWQAELGKKDEWLKSEDFIDLKNENNDKRLKNVGAETPKPAEPTKPIKGKLDEGSGGDKEKGKKLDKAAIPTNPAPGKFTQVASRPGISTATPAHVSARPAPIASAKVAPHSTVQPMVGSRSPALVRGTLVRNEDEMAKNFSAGGRLVMGRGDPRRYSTGNKPVKEAQTDKTPAIAPKPEKSKDFTEAKKAEMGGLAPGGGAENPAVAPLAMSQGGPPTAKPPGGNPTPSKPPMSKPKLPKMKLGKGALPMASTRTRAGAADAQVSSIKGGHETPAAPKPEAAPKMMPKPASEFSDFMPAGKFTQAGAALPKPAAPVVPPKPAPGAMPAAPKVPPGKI